MFSLSISLSISLQPTGAILAGGGRGNVKDLRNKFISLSLPLVWFGLVWFLSGSMISIGLDGACGRLDQWSDSFLFQFWYWEGGSSIR